MNTKKLINKILSLLLVFIFIGVNTAYSLDRTLRVPLQTTKEGTAQRLKDAMKEAGGATGMTDAIRTTTAMADRAIALDTSKAIEAIIGMLSKIHYPVTTKEQIVKKQIATHLSDLKAGLELKSGVVSSKELDDCLTLFCKTYSMAINVRDYGGIGTNTYLELLHDVFRDIAQFTAYVLSKNQKLIQDEKGDKLYLVLDLIVNSKPKPHGEVSIASNVFAMMQGDPPARRGEEDRRDEYGFRYNIRVTGDYAREAIRLLAGKISIVQLGNYLNRNFTDEQREALVNSTLYVLFEQAINASRGKKVVYKALTSFMLYEGKGTTYSVKPGWEQVFNMAKKAVAADIAAAIPEDSNVSVLGAKKDFKAKELLYAFKHGYVQYDFEGGKWVWNPGGSMEFWKLKAIAYLANRLDGRLSWFYKYQDSISEKYKVRVTKFAGTETEKTAKALYAWILLEARPDTIKEITSFLEGLEKDAAQEADRLSSQNEPMLVMRSDTFSIGVKSAQEFSKGKFYYLKESGLFVYDVVEAYLDPLLDMLKDSEHGSDWWVRKQADDLFYRIHWRRNPVDTLEAMAFIDSLDNQMKDFKKPKAGDDINAVVRTLDSRRQLNGAL
ncbi:MAG: hypothetical protein Q7O04_02105 [Candidatus Omnitrophota bacterium]|nr:hypothetical protein [Candidatus Omnitrophota bacterium]